MLSKTKTPLKTPLKTKTSLIETSCNIGIFIFRRDLRLNDNLALIKLSNEVDIIIPIFILDRYQIKKKSHNKHYFSSNAVQFMCESLVDLNNQLLKYNSYLRLYYGNPNKIITLFEANIITEGLKNDLLKVNKERNNRFHSSIWKLEKFTADSISNVITGTRELDSVRRKQKKTMGK
jgi:deoxyribodipyrimidine photolyase